MPDGRSRPADRQYFRGFLALTFLLSCGVTPMGAEQTDEAAFAQARARMVTEQIASRGITDPRVLEAMREVPRHLFVPETERENAYGDHPLPIGWGQTISQPYIVALMTELVEPDPDHRVLEIGTGSGYQAAVIAKLVEHVYTIELEAGLAAEAGRRLAGLGLSNVTSRAGDGYAGWEEHAPFDIIMVTAAPDHIPQPLIDQLKPGGRMVVPVGPAGDTQSLRLIRKDESGVLETTEIAPVRFVPLRRR